MEENVWSIASQEFATANQVVLKATERSTLIVTHLQVTQAWTVKLRSMNVCQILVKMGSVMTLLVTMTVFVRRDGLEKTVKLILMIAWKSPVRMGVTAMIFSMTINVNVHQYTKERTVRLI